MTLNYYFFLSSLHVVITHCALELYFTYCTNSENVQLFQYCTITL